MSAGGVSGFSNDGDLIGMGGVGKRGYGVRTGGVKIGIAFSSANAGIGDSCELLHLTSCIS